MQRKPCGTLEPLPLQGKPWVPHGGAESNAAECCRVISETVAPTPVRNEPRRPRGERTAGPLHLQPCNAICLRGDFAGQSHSPIVRDELRAKPRGCCAVTPPELSRRVTPLSAKTMPSRALVKLVARPRRLTRVWTVSEKGEHGAGTTQRRDEERGREDSNDYVLHFRPTRPTS